MSVMSNWSVNQLGTIINAINKQATGETASIAVTDTGSFVSVAQKVLANASYDKILGSISQILSKTIFSYRPYSSKLKILEKDAIRYGNHVRKLVPIDQDISTEDQSYDKSGSTLADGDSVDQWVIKKPKTAQFNIYSMDVWDDYRTFFEEQIDTAFSSADEFSRFIQMIMQFFTDKLALSKDSLSRSILQNFINGKVKANNGIFHMLTQYASDTGTSLTSATVYEPENFAPFVKWFRGKLEDIRDGLEEYGLNYHINPSGCNILRHTPKKNQCLYMNNKFLNAIKANVIPDVYNKDALDFGSVESIVYWQNQNDPQTIYTKSSWLKSDGTVDYDSTGTKTQNVIGLLVDDEAIGYTVIRSKMNSTPQNARGDYHNIFAKETRRLWNDFTENGVVFLLD